MPTFCPSCCARTRMTSRCAMWISILRGCRPGARGTGRARRLMGAGGFWFAPRSTRTDTFSPACGWRKSAKLHTDPDSSGSSRNRSVARSATRANGLPWSCVACPTARHCWTCLEPLSWSPPDAPVLVDQVKPGGEKEASLSTCKC